MILRDYQRQALEAEARHRAEHPDETRLAIVMATGLGKGTIIAERAVRAIEAGYYSDEDPGGHRVLILAPTEEIVTDLARRCELLAADVFPISVGIVKAEQDDHTADIVVASVQTLLDPVRRARITDVGLVLVDECEAYVAPQWRKVLEHYGCFGQETDLCETCEHARRRHLVIASLGASIPCVDCRECTGFRGREATPALGFTATLERGDGASLAGVWQNVCFTRDISWGVRKGFLVQPIGHRLEIGLPGEDADGGQPRFLGNGGAADDKALIDGLAPEAIVAKWMELAKDRQTVAFMPLVRSAQALRDAFLEAGVAASVVHGTMPDGLRRDVLKDYASGAIQVLVNAMVLTRGWDSPPTKCVIVGRPTKSRGLFIQMAGRGLRPIPGVPVEEQDCILITVADATTDLCTVADLSDRPLPRKAQGALTAMEDEWDIGKELADPTRLWTGQVDARQFDPLVSRSSKVWRTTKHGTPFLPISKDGEYVFVVGTSVYVREAPPSGMSPRHQGYQMRVARLHKDLPDLELAMQVAEDEAQERGGDLGKLLADKGRAWRKEVPSPEMQGRARQLGLGRELDKIMSARAGGKAGKVADLIAATLATRALEPMVERIKEATK